jgi:hypothetical protein
MNLGELNCERDFLAPRHKSQVIVVLLPRFVTPERGNPAARRPAMIRSEAPQGSGASWRATHGVGPGDRLDNAAWARCRDDKGAFRPYGPVSEICARQGDYPCCEIAVTSASGTAPALYSSSSREGASGVGERRRRRTHNVTIAMAVISSHSSIHTLRIAPRSCEDSPIRPA